MLWNGRKWGDGAGATPPAADRKDGSPVMDDLRQLYDKARDGDADAFWQLVLPHRGLVFSVAFGMLRHRERAEDQLHEVLLQAWRSIANLRDPERLPSWLYTMTRNRILDVQRRDQRMARALDMVSHTARVIPVAEAIEKDAWLNTMEAALSELPEPFREILALKYLNQYSLHQIAEILEISEPAVKSRLFQARKLLRLKTEQLATAPVAPNGTEKEQ